MQIVVYNLTSESISASLAQSAREKAQVIQSLTCTSITSIQQHRIGNKDVLALSQHAVSRGASQNVVMNKLKLAWKESWKLVSEDDHWRIYALSGKKVVKLLVLPRRDLSTYLSTMPDATPLSMLCLPGTHDTMAFYGWPISQCQTLKTSLLTQLTMGIRVFDMRLAVIEGKLIAYHGIASQRTPFEQVLKDIHAFLTSNPKEMLIMSFKQEDFEHTPPPTFSQAVHSEIEQGPGKMDMWFLENRIPNLGEVRGRAIMLSRFGDDGTGWDGGLEGMGIHPTTWPDSKKEGFSWQCKNTLVRQHDWYSIPSFLSIPEKFAMSTQILDMSRVKQGEDILNISFLSASSIPLALPPTVSKGMGWPKWGMGFEGVNSRTGKWLLEQITSACAPLSEEGIAFNTKQLKGPMIRGWALMDFYTNPVNLAPLFIECNYYGHWNKG